MQLPEYFLRELANLDSRVLASWSHLASAHGVCLTNHLICYWGAF